MKLSKCSVMTAVMKIILALELSPGKAAAYSMSRIPIARGPGGIPARTVAADIAPK